MKLINSALNDKQIKVADLPEEIKQDMSELKALVLKFNDAVKEYNAEGEKDNATEAKLDDMEDQISDLEKNIVEKINALEKPAPKAAAEGTPAPTPPPAPAPEEKKDGGLGWLIFGGVALVVTLGAVNLFKKR
jgi:peptidoglycan hydrolase CwlO-like protein